MAQCIIKYLKGNGGRRNNVVKRIVKEGTKPVIFPNRSAAKNYIRNHYEITLRGTPEIINCDEHGTPLSK